MSGQNDLNNLLKERVLAAEKDDLPVTVVCLLREYLRRVPNEGYLRYLFAENLRILGRPFEAEKHLLLVKNIPPEKQYVVILSLAAVYDDIGDLAKAVSQFDAAMQSAPNLSIPKIYYAKFLARRGRVAEAIQNLEKVLDSQRDSEVLTLLGNYERALENYDAAITYYRKALSGWNDSNAADALRDIENMKALLEQLGESTA